MGVLALRCHYLAQSLSCGIQYTFYSIGYTRRWWSLQYPIPRYLHRLDDVALRNAEYRRRWPPGDDALAREAGALRCAPACGLGRALTHAERLAGPEAARSVIGRYARTTLVWKAQARALSKVRTLAGACPQRRLP